MALATLITLTDIQLAYGHHPLLDHADFAIQAGERIGLIGRNGAGKSSPVSYTHLTLPTSDLV